MQGRPHRHLGGFQIDPSGLAPLLQHHPQELIYFPPDLLPDRFRRFFSCSFGVSSSTGRKRQIAVLVSTNVSGGEDRSIKAGPVGTKVPTLDGGERGDHYEVRFFAAEF